MTQTVQTVRRGGRYEALGFVAIVVGLVLAIAEMPVAGGLLMVGGFVVFLVGRFM